MFTCFSWPTKLKKNKKITALAALEHEIGKVTYIHTRSRDFHAQGHVLKLRCWFMFTCHSWPKNTRKTKKVTALAALEQEIGKVTYKVTWPSRTRSRVKTTVLVYVHVFFLTKKNWKTRKNHCSSCSGTWDRKGHVQGHVTFTHKVTR